MNLQFETNSERPPSPVNAELDKIPGAWVLTYFLSDGITLRLRAIVTACVDDDHEFVAEVRIGGKEEFQTIHSFACAPWQCHKHNDLSDMTDLLPSIWTDEFAALLELWGHICNLVDVGPTTVLRYPYEPNSSRDAFFCHDTIGTARLADRPKPTEEEHNDGGIV